MHQRTNAEGILHVETFLDGLEKMTNQDNQLTNYRGRARGLIAVWEETRRERNRLRIRTCPTPGHGRAVTLALLNEMVARNASGPGLRHPQPMERGFSVPETDDGTNDLAPCRTRARNPGPHLHGVDPQLDSLIPGCSAFAGDVTSLPYLLQPSPPCP